MTGILRLFVQAAAPFYWFARVRCEGEKVLNIIQRHSQIMVSFMLMIAVSTYSGVSHCGEEHSFSIREDTKHLIFPYLYNITGKSLEIRIIRVGPVKEQRSGPADNLFSVDCEVELNKEKYHKAVMEFLEYLKSRGVSIKTEYVKVGSKQLADSNASTFPISNYDQVFLVEDESRNAIRALVLIDDLVITGKSNEDAEWSFTRYIIPVDPSFNTYSYPSIMQCEMYVYNDDQIPPPSERYRRMEKFSGPTELIDYCSLLGTIGKCTIISPIINGFNQKGMVVSIDDFPIRMISSDPVARQYRQSCMKGVVLRIAPRRSMYREEKWEPYMMPKSLEQIITDGETYQPYRFGNEGFNN